MGKPKSAAGSSAAADDAGVVKKPEGDWQRSSMRKTNVELLRAQGLLPPADQVQVRVPGKEVFPTPRDGERVCFADFLPRGFGFPMHDFVRGFLYAYGVQIHDLTPNGVLSIAGFIVLCECFLGVAPHWALWKSLFLVRKNVGKSGLTFPVGGFGIQVRGDTAYFQMKKSDSVQGWRRRWFYVQSNDDGLDAFDGKRGLRKTGAWAHPLSAVEKEAVRPLLSLLHELTQTLGRDAGGVFLMATFFRLRVQPLSARPHPMWAAEGVSAKPLDDEEVEASVRSITNLRAADTCNVKCPISPYGASNPVPEVSLVLSSLCPCST